MKRRNFIKSSAVTSASLLMPGFLKNMTDGFFLNEQKEKTLIIIQLSGGNDGLNTVIPFENDIYYNLRPTLSIPKNEVIGLSDSLGFNPALAALRALFDEGSWSIINNVGYPNPDRSHFRSMDIWHTASESNEYLRTGWLGRYLDNECANAAAYHALEVDDGLSLAMKGNLKNGFAMNNVKSIRWASQNRFLKQVGQYGEPSEENISYLYKTLTDTQHSAQYLYEKSKIQCAPWAIFLSPELCHG